MKKLGFFLAAVFAGLFAAQNAQAYTAIWTYNTFPNSSFTGTGNTAAAANANAQSSCNARRAMAGGFGACSPNTVFVNTCYAIFDNSSDTVALMRGGRYVAIGHATENEAISAARQICIDMGETNCNESPNFSGCDVSCAGANEIAGAAACENCPAGTGMVANDDNDACECPGNLMPNAATNVCECPPGDELVPGQTDQCRTPVDCSGMGDLIRNTATNMCECPSGDELVPGQTDQCRTPVDCSGMGDLIRNTATNVCECPPGDELVPGQTDQCRTPVDCSGMGDLIRNTATNVCECPTGQTLVSGTTDRCETPSTPVVCTGDLQNIGGVCQCPTGQTLVSGTTDQCETPSTPVVCRGDLQNIGGVCQCPTGTQPVSGTTDRCETPPAPPPTPVVQPSDDLPEGKKVFIGAMAAKAVLIAYYSGVFGAWHFTPEYAFSDGKFSSYGGKLHYEHGGFSAFWSGGDNNGGYYSEGAKYAKDFYNIGYTATMRGGETDLDLYADMAYQNFQTGITADWTSDKTDSAFSLGWQNRMAWQYADWQITPSANLFWYDGGDNMNFRVRLRRDF